MCTDYPLRVNHWNLNISHILIYNDRLGLVYGCVSMWIGPLCIWGMYLHQKTGSKCRLWKVNWYEPSTPPINSIISTIYSSLCSLFLLSWMRKIHLGVACDTCLMLQIEKSGIYILITIKTEILICVQITRQMYGLPVSCNKLICIIKVHKMWCVLSSSII
jgi:hypothetical protein